MDDIAIGARHQQVDRLGQLGRQRGVLAEEPFAVGQDSEFVLARFKDAVGSVDEVSKLANPRQQARTQHRTYAGVQVFQNAKRPPDGKGQDLDLCRSRRRGDPEQRIVDTQGFDLSPLERGRGGHRIDKPR